MAKPFLIGRSTLFALALALALAFALSATARADDSFVAKTQLYIDNDRTTVVSPLVAITRDAWRGGTLDASYVADVVSSASIDVVSNATAHMDDFRSEITAGLTQKLKASTLSASYIYSTEHDYSSHNVSLGFAQDLFQRNTTLALGWSLSDNSVGRVGDQAFHRSLLVTGIGATWTQALTPATIGQLSYTFSYAGGYEASPYRFVPVDDGMGSTLFKVPETEPGQRFRHAFVAGINRHLFTDTSLQGDYRFYFDDWGVQSHTIQLRYFVTFKDVTLRLRERFYYQSGASFYKPHYTTIEPYMVTDRELSTFWSTLTGAKVTWRLPWVSRALALEAKCDFFYFGYVDFPLLANRIGATVEGGLTVIY